VDQNYYVLVTGRWFRARALTGPWSYVAGKELPVDFFRIPDTSPKENVKASVPGTAQAKEAAIAAEIPHMASVYTDKVSFQPVVSGDPVLKPIEGTSLLYVFNSPPGGWAATSGNVYNHYGSTSTVSRSSTGYNAYTGTAWSSKAGTSYNSTTGRVSAGQSAAATNAYGGYASGNRGATCVRGLATRTGDFRPPDRRLLARVGVPHG